MDKKKIIIAVVVVAIIVLAMLLRPSDPAAPGEREAGVPPESLTIFYTCDTRGHIEPCGCSSGMAGGVTRRMAWLEQAPHTSSLLVDAGDVTAGGQADRIAGDILVIVGNTDSFPFPRVALAIANLSAPEAVQKTE